MERKPITNQRSKWVAMPDPLGGLVAAFKRDVGDGRLVALVAKEEGRWHLSISHRRYVKGKAVHVRYPRWDEIAQTRYDLCAHVAHMVMHLPPPEDYVALHDTTFHLWEAVEGEYRPC